jgi:hypothetical protein
MDHPESASLPKRRMTARQSAGRSPARLGHGDGWSTSKTNAWTSVPAVGQSASTFSATPSPPPPLAVGGGRLAKHCNGRMIAQQVYGTFAALLFAACAFAQLNDPDPELWVGLYVGGGCALTATAVSERARTALGNLSNNHIRTCLSWSLVVYATVGAQLATVLYPKVVNILEVEREVSGGAERSGVLAHSSKRRLPPQCKHAL